MLVIRHFFILIRRTLLLCLLVVGAMSVALASRDVRSPGMTDTSDAPLSRGEQAWLKDHPIIRLGIDPDFAPYEWINERGQYVGIAADYIALLEKRLGIKFEVVKDKSWSEILQMAKRGELDMLSAAVKTPEREQYLLFSAPYVKTPIIIIDDGQQGFAGSLERLKDRRVSIEKGYFMEELLRKNHPEIELVIAKSVQDALRLVVEHKADAYVGDAASATYAIKADGFANLRYSGATPYISAHSMAVVNAQPELARIVAQSLSTIASAEQEEIVNRWMGLKTSDGIKSETVLFYGLGGALLMLLIGYWNWRLHREIRARTTAEQTMHETTLALRESESFNISVLDSLVEHIAVLDAKGVIVSVNLAWRRFAKENGARDLAENSIGQSYWAACECSGSPACLEVARAREGLQAVLSGEQKNFGMEYTCHSPEQQRWFYLYAVPLKGSEGGIVVIHQNISELKQSAQQLAEGRQQLELALTGGNLGLWDIHLLTDTFAYNDRLVNMLGYARAELIPTTQTFALLVHRDDLPELRDLFLKTLKGTLDQFQFEFRMRHKNDSWLWIAARGKVVERDSASKAVRMTGTSLDITERRKNDAILHARESRLSALISSLQDLVLVFDTGGIVQEIFRPPGELTYSLSLSKEILGKSCFELFNEEVATLFLDSITQIIIGGDVHTFQYAWLTDGSLRHYEATMSKLSERAKFPTGFLAVVRDVTTAKTDRQMVEQLGRRNALLLESVGEGIIGVNAESKTIFINSAALTMLGFTRAELMGADTHALIHHHAASLTGTQSQCPMKQTLLDGKTRRTESETFLHKNGSRFPVSLTVAPIATEGAQEGAVMVFQNISERQKAEEEIRNLAFFDPLTHLPNRRLLNDRLNQALSTATRNSSFGAVLFLDLDKFKTLNDAYGHDAGDQLLIEVAHRLRSCVRDADTVARQGGDEFVIVLEEMSSNGSEALTQARNVAEKIRLAIAEPYQLSTLQHRTSTSIGVCLFQGNGEPASTILLRADKAMYQAKAAGRNQIRLFEASEIDR